MPEKEFRSELPSPEGSPFKTKNFNKFFFGIMIAALVLGAIILAYFLFGFGKHSQTHPASSIRVPNLQTQTTAHAHLS